MSKEFKLSDANLIRQDHGAMVLRAKYDSNYSCLFNKLPWLGDSEDTLRLSSQAATCPSVYAHTTEASPCPFFFAENQARKL